MRVGVDTGGTFTDFVVIDDDGGVRTHKVRSTPSAPERAILRGLEDLGVVPSGIAMVHGSTVATNAVLEGKGARTAFITSHGFGDTLTIGRQAREHLYDLQPPVPTPPVPQVLCLETGGRVTPAGEILEPLTEPDLDTLRGRIESLAPEAVAISLLFSFIDDSHERRVASAMPASLFVSRSSEVLPELREYERGIATWLNARVGPLMAGYLDRLAAGMPGAHIAVMQSSAGTVDASLAARQAVHLLLSGPAGGVMGAALAGSGSGASRLLTFDMGGTSTDVALVDGAPRLTSEGRVAGYPIAVPMVDIHTIGAGGGSVAWIDAGGALQVGPHSAGAEPGPACYGGGGVEPTVTDAHLVLGRLPRDLPLGGTLGLDTGAARAAFEPVARQLDLSIERVAEGVLRIAEEHMVQALRVISVERGEDPRDYALFPFGGAGGLHVCALAERLGVRRAVFPANAGVLSAFGMLAAPSARDLSRSMPVALAGMDRVSVEGAFDALSAEGIAALVAEGAERDVCTAHRSADLRYKGQSFTLNLPWSDSMEDAFHGLHENRYGHRLEAPVELVNLRVRVEAKTPKPRLPRRAPGLEVAARYEQEGVPVYESLELPAGQTLTGPAIVAAPDSTLWLAPGWRAEVDGAGNLLLSQAAGARV